MGAGTVGFWAETTSIEDVFKDVAVVTGRLALPQSEDIGETNQHRHDRRKEGNEERRTDNHEQNKEHRDARADAANEPPKQIAFQTPCPAFGIGRSIGIGQSQLVFSVHGWVSVGPFGLCTN